MRLRGLRIAGIIAVIVPVLVLAGTVASEGRMASHATRPRSPHPVLALTPLSGRLAGVASRFSRTYAGYLIKPSGGLTIYVTRRGYKSMASALANAAGRSGQSAYRLRLARRSAASLEALTTRIARDRRQLFAHGIALYRWGPDVATNTVKLYIAGYDRSAAGYLRSRYGRWVSATAYNPLLAPRRVINRFYDVAPFWSGDRIWFNNDPAGAKCSDAFTLQDKSTGQLLGTTAAHCSGASASVWTNFTDHYEMGPVLAHYFSNNGYDAEDFSCDCGSNVWANYGDGTANPVGGYCKDCTVDGVKITTDGATSGEVSGNIIDVSMPFCQTFDDGKTTCHLWHAQNPNGATICDSGDSGGPLYERSNTSYVYAAGLIVGTSDGTDCFYHTMQDMANLFNSYLYEGTGDTAGTTKSSSVANGN